MITKVFLPQLGEGVTQATLSYWFFQQGERVGEKDDLVELTTDKSTFNLPSPVSGTLMQVFMHEGDTVHPGDLLGVIE